MNDTRSIWSNDGQGVRYILDLMNGWHFDTNTDEENCYLLGAEMANYGDATVDSMLDWQWL